MMNLPFFKRSDLNAWTNNNGDLIRALESLIQYVKDLTPIQASNAVGKTTKFSDGTMIFRGKVSIAPTPGVPTSAVVNFPVSFRSTDFQVVVSANSVAPGTVTEVTYSDIAIDSVKVWINRADAVVTEISILCLGDW